MKTYPLIKGAIYSNGDLLLRPHYSGHFTMVDCTEYKTKKEIKQTYSKEDAKEFLSEGPYTYQGVEYFQCEYSPYGTENLELLSDISDLEFFDYESDF